MELLKQYAICTEQSRVTGTVINGYDQGIFYGGFESFWIICSYLDDKQCKNIFRDLHTDQHLSLWCALDDKYAYNMCWNNSGILIDKSIRDKQSVSSYNWHNDGKINSITLSIEKTNYTLQNTIHYKRI